jgi:hypothetical protein
MILFQLLLLGDCVAEAGAELASACHRFNYSSIPFRFFSLPFSLKIHVISVTLRELLLKFFTSI